MLRVVGCGLLLARLVGCASDDVGGSTPLPYSVLLYSIDTTDAEAAESTRVGVRYRHESADLLERLAKDLVARGVVARADAVDVNDTAAALGAARNSELLVGVKIETPQLFGEPSIHGGWATLEVVTWLFGGVPAWFVPSLRYDAATTVDLAIHDMNAVSVQSWFGSGQANAASTAPPDAHLHFAAAAGEQGSSLHDRAGFKDDLGEYALTLIVPPMVLAPGNIERSSRTLTEEIDEQISAQLETGLKAALLANEESQPLRIVFDEPLFDPDRSEALFRIVSRTRSPLSAFDIHVRSLDESGAIRSEVAPWRWKAEGMEIDRLGGKISSDGEVAVARVLPLRPGTNLVTLRARSQDGARVSRTLIIEGQPAGTVSEEVAARARIDFAESLVAESLVAEGRP